jgi:hypothetical protein
MLKSIALIAAAGPAPCADQRPAPVQHLEPVAQEGPADVRRLAGLADLKLRAERPAQS